MARRASEISLAMGLMVSMLFAQVSAQVGCASVLVGLLPCLSYVVGNSTKPSSGCCTQLAGVVSNQPQCLCMVLNGGIAPQLGITLNNTQALTLPGACNVKTPAVSQCNAVAGGAPAGAPVGSPSATPAAQETPSTASSPAPATTSEPSVPGSSGGGSKSVPSTNGQTSGGVPSNSAHPMMLSFFLFAAFAATVAKF